MFEGMIVIFKKLLIGALVFVASLFITVLAFGGPICIIALIVGFGKPAYECQLARTQLAWTTNQSCVAESQAMVTASSCAIGTDAQACSMMANDQFCVVLVRCGDGALRNATSLLERFSANRGNSPLCSSLSGRNRKRMLSVRFNPLTQNDTTQKIQNPVNLSLLDACNSVDSLESIALLTEECQSEDWWHTFCIVFIVVYVLAACAGCCFGAHLDLKDAKKRARGYLLLDKETPGSAMEETCSACREQQSVEGERLSCTSCGRISLARLRANANNYGGTENAECAICLAALQTGESVITLRCAHSFHLVCIEELAKAAVRTPTCPACKSLI
jgi:hypothetical protein